MTAGGDVTAVLENGGSVGEQGNVLSLDVGGVLTLTAADGQALEGVFLESPADRPLTIAPLEAQTIAISTLGDILPAGMPEGEAPRPDFTAVELTLNSVDGSVGTKDAPVESSAEKLSLMGSELHIHNDQTVTLGEVIADTEAVIRADGSILAGDGPDDGVVAGTLELIATGDVGSKDNPLPIETDTVSAQGGNVHLTSEGDVVVDRIVAGNEVTIQTDGSVRDTGTSTAITAGSLTIVAGGYIGTADNPLNVNVRGPIFLTSGIPWNFLSNSYRKPEPPQLEIPALLLQPARRRPHRYAPEEELPEIPAPERNEQPDTALPEPSPPDQPAAGSLLWLLPAALAVLLLFLLLLLLFWRRRRRDEQTAQHPADPS